MQVAWNLVNDSLRTTCCLRYKPKMIAIAAIYLASKMINQSVQLETLPNLKALLLPHVPLLGLEMALTRGIGHQVQELEEIGNEILDLYDKNACDKPAGAATLPPKAALGKPGTAPPKPPPKPPSKPPAPKPPPPPVAAVKKEEGSAGGTKRPHDTTAAGSPEAARSVKVAKVEGQPK